MNYRINHGEYILGWPSCTPIVVLTMLPTFGLQLAGFIVGGDEVFQCKSLFYHFKLARYGFCC